MPEAELLRAVDDLEQAIRAAAGEIEATRRLPDHVIDGLKRAGLFRMPMPESWGGPEVDPLAQFRVVERLSTIDASVGWCAMIGSDGGYYSANLDDDAARELWTDLDDVTAGWLFPGGTATPVDGGYTVKGRWAFGSASLHAQVMVAGCLVPHDGGIRLRADGGPELRIVVVPAAEVTSVDTWHTTGLAGSGSNDYVIDDVFVPEEHSWAFLEPPQRDRPLYRFPYMFFGNIAAVPLGAARAAADELIALAHEKITLPAGTAMRDEARTQTAVATIESLIAPARAWALEVLEEIWATVTAGDAVDAATTARFRLSVMHAFRAAKQAADLAYETAGTTAIYRPHPLDRILRDLTTMGQHMLGSTRTLEPAGRVLLGLAADAPVF